MKPYDFKWTKFYELNSGFPYTGLLLELAEDELIICSTVIDTNNYSILTTRRLICKKDGRKNSGIMKGSSDKGYGDFKGYEDKELTEGKIQLQNGSDLLYFIETGRASMIMIHGIRTLIRKQKSTDG